MASLAVVDSLDVNRDRAHTVYNGQNKYITDHITYLVAVRVICIYLIQNGVPGVSYVTFFVPLFSALLEFIVNINLHNIVSVTTDRYHYYHCVALPPKGQF